MSTAPPTTPQSSVRALNCTQCGGILSLRAAGYTVSLVCEHCGATLDTTDPDLRVIATATAAVTRPPIALGTRGVLRGETWEVVGYLERSDGEESWSEYLLFNPYRGYGWLIDDGRRFSYGFLLDRLPELEGTQFVVDGKGFDWDSGPYPVEVSFVVGEFYWRVAVGERVRVTDYARPGTMLSCEENESERTWSKLDLLEWGEAERAFNVQQRARPDGDAPAPHEPSPWRDRMVESLIIAAVAAVTLIIISTMGSRVDRLASVNAEVGLDGAPRTVVIHDITIPQRSSAVGISAQSDQLDNDWIDLDYSLVDKRTQESFDSYGLAEHYSGSDSDGSWSEGDTRPNTRLSSIPPGTYDLVVELSAHRWVANSSPGFFGSIDANPVPIPVTINVDRGGVFGGNIILGLILILIWPAFVAWRHYSFEKRRSGFAGDDDDDDD